MMLTSRALVGVLLLLSLTFKRVYSGYDLGLYRDDFMSQTMDEDRDTGLFNVGPIETDFRETTQMIEEDDLTTTERMTVDMVTTAVDLAPPNALSSSLFGDAPPAPLLESAAVCGAGFYSLDGFTSCFQCETGTFSSAGVTGGCTRCSPGKYSAGTGATQCVLCDAGKFSFFEGSSVCTNCPAWTGSAAGMSACVTCRSANSTQPCIYSNQIACPPCQSACVPCNAGYYNDGTENRCKACGAGTYYGQTGAVSSAACLQCPSGTFAYPADSGLSVCRQCSTSAFKAATNADYVSVEPETYYSPFVCAWKCKDGYTEQNVVDTMAQSMYDSLYNYYRSQMYSDIDSRRLVVLKNNYCCGTFNVGVGQKLVGCTRNSAGTVYNCDSIPNAYFIDGGGGTIDRCGYWKCNDGFFRSNNMCNPQPVCADGMTYRRNLMGELDLVFEYDSTGKAIPESGKYVCVPCPVCADGTETVSPCNSTHSATCRLCGGDRALSVNGAPCVRDAPYGFRPVSRSSLLSSLPWGVRPTLRSDNSVLQAVGDTIVFYFFIGCTAVSEELAFTNKDAVCRLDSGQDCTVCETQCSPWKRTGGWFEGMGWYGSGSSCTPCQFDPNRCSSDQFLNMSTCGPTSSPQCMDCPSVLSVPDQLAWTKPMDPTFNANDPCKVICKTGFNEENNQCLDCPPLTEHAARLVGCEWNCLQGYNRVGDLCIQCPPQMPCAVGFYQGYTADFNVCLSCMPCTLPGNAVFTTNGTRLNDAGSCKKACIGSAYASGDACIQCSQPTCTNGVTYLQPCSANSNARCVSCQVCNPGFLQVQECSGNSDTVCSPCAQGLLPANASWMAAGCTIWTCNTNFWRNGNTCILCKATCSLGERIIGQAGCQVGAGECVACLQPPAGYCFNGDSSCGTAPCGNPTQAAVVSSVKVTTTSVRSTSITPATTSKMLSPSTVRLTSVSFQASNTTPRSTTTTRPAVSSSLPPPTTSSAPEPVAFATVASLTIDETITRITAGLLDDLVSNVSKAVCMQGIGFCNITVLSVTVNNVTTYCTDGVCPGFSSRRRRSLLETGVGGGSSGIVVGIVTQKQLPDVSKSLKEAVSVIASLPPSIAPNAPVNSLDQLRDSRSLIQYVIKTQTVYIVSTPQNDLTGTLIAVVAVVVVLICLGAYCCCCRGERVLVVVQPDTQASLLVPTQPNAPRAPVLESIRITRENYKPFVKIA